VNNEEIIPASNFFKIQNKFNNLEKSKKVEIKNKIIITT
jgi:hypothetical protein